MGERYLITGVQLGMLIETPKETQQCIVRDIMDKQFIYFTDNTDVEDDTEKIVKLMGGV